MSVCFPRIPVEITEEEVAQMFEGVDHVDLVLMEDNKGEFNMAFVHFIEPDKMLGFVDQIAVNEIYINGWLVKPNYRPVKRSTRKWSQEDLALIEEYFQEMESKR